MEIKNLASKINTKRPFEEKYNHCKSILGLIENENKEIIVNYTLPSHWVQTFLAGEGMFYNYIDFSDKKSRCDSSLEIGQNSHDICVLLALKNFFKVGYIKPKYNFLNLAENLKSRSVNRLIIRDTEVIIKFVNDYPMLTMKQLDYLNWKQIVELKKSNLHKTEEGKALIVKLQSNMNSSRNY